MDLSNFIPTTDEVVVELNHPKTKESLGATITLYAPHTAEYKEVVYDMVDKSLARGEEKPSAKELDEDRVDRLVKITKSWDIEFEGSKPKLTKTKAKEIYTKLPFVVSQLERGLEESEGFM